MTAFWKSLVIIAIISQFVNAYADYRQHETFDYLFANAICQEAHVVLNYQLLAAVSSDQIPDPNQLVDTESACAEFYKLNQEYQADAAGSLED
jgi:hypothetical protein